VLAAATTAAGVAIALGGKPRS